MTMIEIIRFVHLLSYLVITGQLMYYFFVMATALQKVSIENFVEQRKIVDPLVQQRHIPVYYVCLVLSVAVVVLLIPAWHSPLFVSVLIALACLILDIVLAKKENVPINNVVNKHTVGDPGIDWENLRTQWLSLIRIRGGISLVGFVSLLAGIFWQ
jgi:hypothetical protein